MVSMDKCRSSGKFLTFPILNLICRDFSEHYNLLVYNSNNVLSLSFPGSIEKMEKSSGQNIGLSKSRFIADGNVYCVTHVML